jgi:hypothetical protein
MSSSTTNSVVPDYLLAGDSDELSLLLQQSFPRKKQSKRISLEKDDLLTILKQYSTGSLINSLKSKFQGQQTLSDKKFSTLHFVDQLFEMYHDSSQLHEDISCLTDQFRPLVASSLIEQDGFILDKNHSIQQCITAIQINTLGWQPEKGRSASRYIETLGELTREITKASDAGALLKAKRSLLLFFNKDLKRIEKIGQRLRDTEKGIMQSRHAKETSTLELNKKMRGHKLPEAVIQFLHTAWRDSLQLTLITYSQDSDQWQQMLKLTDRLIVSFQQSGGDNTLATEIPKITEELKNHTVSLIHNKQGLEAQLSIIATEHFKILQGDTLNYQPFRLIDENNPLISAQAKVSRNLIKEVENIKQGQWFFLHKVNQQPSRIRLALKSDDVSQLLFINQQGLKVENFSFEEFAYKLSSKIAIAIKPAPNFNEFAYSFIAKLFIRQEEKKNQKNQAREDAKRTALQEDEQRIEARAKAIAEATILAEVEAEKREQKNQSEASQLTIGGWIEFTKLEGETIKCRLAAKLQTTNMYIFVDRRGLKQEEIDYDELLKRINNGEAKIIQQGDYTDDPLATVVDNLRK